MISALYILFQSTLTHPCEEGFITQGTSIKPEAYRVEIIPLPEVEQQVSCRAGFGGCFHWLGTKAPESLPSLSLMIRPSPWGRGKEPGMEGGDTAGEGRKEAVILGVNQEAPGGCIPRKGAPNLSPTPRV